MTDTGIPARPAGQAQIPAVAGGPGNSGNVAVDPQFAVLSNSRVLASASGGDGGNITIVSPDRQFDSSQVGLPVACPDAVNLLQERCSACHLGDRSSLVVAGRSVLPMTPDSPYSLSSGLQATAPARSERPRTACRGSGSAIPWRLSGTGAPCSLPGADVDSRQA